MANQIQLQADIGTIGLHGLGAFSQVLATLSADNIAPMALLQMEKLGGSLHTSGKFAGKVPDLLRRFSTQPLGRLAVALGWRKGDTASMLADTAGGQSAALLSVLLVNLYHKDVCGEILSQLCSRLLPTEVSVASVAQLGDVAKLLAQKLFPLGFGNFLPDQVVRIHHVYSSLGIEPPEDILETLTVDAMVGLLYSISQALCEDGRIVRISGSLSTAHIHGLLLFMFPHDTVVTVEDIVIHEGERQSIHLELRKDPPGPGAITVESTVVNSTPFYSSIKIEGGGNYILPYHFAWPGCIARALEMTFLELGSVCTQEILEAFCNLLVAIPNIEHPTSVSDSNGNNFIPQGGLIALLGLYPQDRMDKTCQAVLGTTPTSYDADPRTAFLTFAEKAQAAVDVDRRCSCVQDKCVFADGWNNAPKVACRVFQMWQAIGTILGAGVMCFFINDRPNTTANPGYIRMTLAQRILMHAVFNTKSSFTMQDIYDDVMGLCGGGGGGTVNCLAWSQGSTIYPTALETLHISSVPGVSFELIDGSIIFEGRYYSSLTGVSPVSRLLASKPVTREQSAIKPSSIGVHDSLLMTLREISWGIQIRATARYAGTNIHLRLHEIIWASMSLKRTSACPHSKANPLSHSLDQVIPTSIAAPCSPDGTIAIAMTHANPTAQLLCCAKGARMILMQDCCLDCAVEQAIAGKFDMIIVS